MESVSEGGEGREGSEVKRGARVGEGERESARVSESRRGSVRVARVGECRVKSSSFFISTMKYLIFKHFSICAPFSHFII